MSPPLPGVQSDLQLVSGTFYSSTMRVFPIDLESGTRYEFRVDTRNFLDGNNSQTVIINTGTE